MVKWLSPEVSNLMSWVRFPLSALWINKKLVRSAHLEFNSEFSIPAIRTLNQQETGAFSSSW